MGTERFDFPGPGGRRLSGRLERAIGRRRGAILFAHCFTCGKAALPAVRISRALAQRGFDVLRFDFAGLGESEGDFADLSFTANLDDLHAAAEAMSKADFPPDLLVGHSLGGAAAIAAVRELPSVQAVATIGAPADLEHLLALLGDNVAVIEAHGLAEVDLGGARPARIGRALLDSLRAHDLKADITALTVPLLVLQAPEDRVVSADNGIRLFTSAGGSRSFISLDGSDHLLSNPDHVAYAADVLCAWSGLRTPQPTVPEPEHGAVEVAETGAGYQVEIVTTSGRFLADEPEAVGGLGTGPTPFELLAAALGACTAMTLRMYAQRKNIDLPPVAVSVAHGRAGGRDHFDRQLHLPESVDERLASKLLEIAEKCPVHRTLRSGAAVVTRSAPPVPQSPRDEHASAIGEVIAENG